MLPASIGVESVFWSGEIKTRYKSSAPTVQLYGETPGGFPARGWDLQEGRLLFDSDVNNARDVCVLGSLLATMGFVPAWLAKVSSRPAEAGAAPVALRPEPRAIARKEGSL